VITTYRVVSALVIIAVLGGAGYLAYQRFAVRVPGLVSESIEHEGDVWRAEFKVRVAAPPADVFDAIRNVEAARSERVREVTVLSDEGDSKTVRFEIEGPAGRTIRSTLEFRYFPAEGRVTYRTTEGTVLDTNAEYVVSADGAATSLVMYREETRIRERVPLPDGMMRRVIREIFIGQLEGLHRSLGIAFEDQADEEVVVP
jgi:carbon monoxide dehydrogenase subunit G